MRRLMRPDGALRRVLATAAVIAGIAGVVVGAPPAKAATPVLLPNGRTVTPAGLLMSGGDFPAAAVAGPGGIFVSDAGVNPNLVVAFSRSDLTATYVTPKPVIPPSFNNAPWAQTGSVVLSPDGKTIYIAGGATHLVEAFSAASPPVPKASYDVGGFVGQVAVTGDGGYIFASLPLAPGSKANPYGKGNTLVRYRISDGQVTPVTVGRHPWPVAVAKTNGTELVATGNRDDGTVTVLRTSDIGAVRTISVGRQPSAIAFSRDGAHMLVLCSLDDTLVDIRTSDWQVVQRLNLSAGGPGAAPDALAISPAGDTAYVALGYENAIAVLRRVGSTWMVVGRIPTAQYPTAVVLDGADLFVTAGKGVGQEQGIPPGLPIPDGQPVNPGSSGLGLSGSIEKISVPDAPGLASYTVMVDHNNRLLSSHVATEAMRQVKHVFYVIRENKTYDEELGDEPGGAPAALLYGKPVTPNTHAIAERFALLTNFYADEEVSDTGHQAVMGGEANDWVQRFTQQAYGLDGAPRPGAELGNGSDILWAPANYLMDQALSAGLDFRDYGEFVRQDQSQDGPAVTPALESHVERKFPGFGFDPGTPDTKRIAYWKTGFDADVKAGTVPALEVIYLPEDHTSSGDPNAPLPQTQVASSDLATGQLVDAISHSSAWSSSAIFMTEDDPQSGVDHVDEHRTVGFVAGPMVKAGAVNTRYDQAGMLRTIQEILALPPLTQVDATARPMDDLFACGVDTTPYDAIAPQVGSVPATTANAVHAMYAQRASGFGMDEVPPSVQRDIQWFSVRGTPYQPPFKKADLSGRIPAGASGCGISLARGAVPATAGGGLPRTSPGPPLLAVAVIAMVLLVGLGSGFRTYRASGRPKR